MRAGLFVAGGCLGLLAGALVLSHHISTPEPVTLAEPLAPAPAVAAPVAAPPVVVNRAPPPPPPPPEGLQRPEFDAADATLANPNASNGSVRDALGLFQRCVQYEPANKRCVASLQTAQARAAALPPDPEPVVVDDPKFRAVGETLNRKRDLARLRTLPSLKNTAQIPERMKVKLEEK
jgi:hypothetical protein